MVGYQVDDDSKSLHGKWLDITISIHLEPACLGYQWLEISFSAHFHWFTKQKFHGGPYK